MGASAASDPSVSEDEEYALKQNGQSGYFHLLDELEKRLLEELKNMLEGKESDAAALASAAEIIKAANAVQEEAQKAYSGAAEKVDR